MSDAIGDIGFQRVKAPNGALGREFLTVLRDLFHADTFVETGTFRGDTACEASLVFRHVHTIELSEGLFNDAEKRFRDTANVTVHRGDSGSVLAKLYPGLHGRKILWLDGHYSEGVTARGQKNTPILEEIGALRGTDPDQVIVLIDDIRLFTKASDAVSGHDSVLGYPTLIEIYAKLLEVSPEFELYVIEDVAIGFSRAHPVTVTPLVRACTVSRFADEAGFAPADITASEQTIMHASGTELAAIESLPEDFLATEKLGFGYHYRYCLALTLLGRGQHAKALLEFARIFGMGYRSSRIELHIADAAQRSGDPQLVDWATQLISAARDDVRNDVARQ